ncbi:MAG: DsbA family protein, partial [Deltaproteobacteria bacterium]|nr:DsbA family protein [Deltaproteobacteria bacterium]
MITKLFRAVFVVVLLLLNSHQAFPQSTEELKGLRKDLEELKRGQSAIQKELEAIKSLLQPRQPPPSVQPVNLVFSIDSDPFKGSKNAKLTLIEFSDYQCPFCARHLFQTAPQIEKDYIQTGKVRYVLKDFPIASIHPQAFKGHEAAHCAGEQGKYWEMHGRLFANQKAMSPKDLSDHAQALALDMPKFQQCLDSGKHAAKIRKNLADGQKAGVQGTPSFFLALPEPNDGM